MMACRNRRLASLALRLLVFPWSRLAQLAY